MADIIKAFLPMLMTVVTAFLLGLIAIPLLRAKKTGRFEPRIGSRFASDGSEPVMGGAVLAAAFSVWYFPTLLSTDLTNSTNKQDSREGLIFAGIYVIIIVCAGIADDRLKHFLARPAGVSPVFMQALIYVSSLSLTLALAVYRTPSTEVILPFNLGFIEFGALYYPLTALVMTLAVNGIKLHFCFGSDISSSVGGLTEVTGALSLLTVSLSCKLTGCSAGALFSDIAAAACIGLLLWTFPPSKLVSGGSGSACIGAMLACAVLLSKLELLFLLAALPQLTDVLFALVRYLRFRLSKGRPGDKRGSPRRSFHMLLRQRGFDDIRIITVFSLAGLAGGALSLAFAHYAQGFFPIV